MAETKATNLLNNIDAELKEGKHAINSYFAIMKLKLPTQLKNLTIGQLKQIGGSIDPDIMLPKETGGQIRLNAEVSRKRTLLFDKLNEIKDEMVKSVIAYYHNNLKPALSKEFLKKNLCDLSDEEKKNCFG